MLGNVFAADHRHRLSHSPHGLDHLLIVDGDDLRLGVLAENGEGEDAALLRLDPFSHGIQELRRVRPQSLLGSQALAKHLALEERGSIRILSIELSL